MLNLEGRRAGPDHTAIIRDVRRVNLDAIAAKSERTISDHRRETLRKVRECEAIGKTPSLEPRGPMPVADLVGMGVAIEVLEASIHREGRNEKHVQFATLLKIRAAATRNYDSLPAGALEMASFARGTGRVRPTACPTQSNFFVDFLIGCEHRMGSMSKANHGTSIEVLVKVIDHIRSDAEAAESTLVANELWKLGAYLTTCIAASLRGNEGFMMDLAAMRQHIDKGRNGVAPARVTKSTILTEQACLNLPFVAICLFGKYKGETIYDHHVINVANETKSGVRPRWWFEKLITVCESEGRDSGPAFALPNGRLASSLEYHVAFQSYMLRVQEEDKMIDPTWDVKTMFGISRTPRKSAQTRLQNAQFGKDFQNRFSRWRTAEKAGARRVRRAMNDHYAEAILLMPVTWVGSYVL